MTDAGKDGIEECKRMQDIVHGMNSSTRIFVASIRDIKSLGDLMSHGMDSFNLALI